MDTTVCGFIVIILFLLQGMYYKAQEEIKKKYFLMQMGTIILMDSLLVINLLWVNHQIPLPILIFMLAIVVSFIGDLFMARIIKITSKKIIDGILGFSVAHVFYIIGLLLILQEREFMTRDVLFIVLGVLILGEIIYYLISREEENLVLRVGGMGYGLLLLGMMSLALVVLIAESTILTAVLFLGAFMFMVSDFLIAVREFRFKGEKQSINNFIHPLYIFGQFLLQISVGFLYA